MFFFDVFSTIAGRLNSIGAILYREKNSTLISKTK